KYSILPILENDTANWFPNLSDESGDFKRLKRTTSVGEFIENNASSGSITRAKSTSSLSKLQFRDHIWTYSQRYLAAEAVEEAAAAIIRSEEGEKEEKSNEDGMKLVQQLISCAEAVACRDKSHASFLLSELRASALVFGSSFQRVASCFVQGLADRLALVQPLGT
ncbi:DELLA RGL1-like, partial [Olea europaea subsp. europaea]